MLLCASHQVRLYNAKPNKAPMSLTSSSLWSSQGTDAPIHINYLIRERDCLLLVWGKIKCAVDRLGIRKSKSICCHPSKETVLLRLKPGNNLGLSTHVSCAGLQGPALYCLCQANHRNGHHRPLKTVSFFPLSIFFSFYQNENSSQSLPAGFPSSLYRWAL